MAHALVLGKGGLSYSLGIAHANASDALLVGSPRHTKRAKPRPVDWHYWITHLRNRTRDIFTGVVRRNRGCLVLLFDMYIGERMRSLLSTLSIPPLPHHHHHRRPSLVVWNAFSR